MDESKGLEFEQELINTMLKTSMHRDVDPLGAELFIRLYIEPDTISMDELAKKTGYSLSAISGKMKMLEAMGAVQIVKKPGTKKLFFHADKNTGTQAIKRIRLLIQREIMPLKKALPPLLEKYSKDVKKTKDERFKQQYDILKDYIIQLEYMEISMQTTIKKIEELIDTHCRTSGWKN